VPKGHFRRESAIFLGTKTAKRDSSHRQGLMKKVERMERGFLTWTQKKGKKRLFSKRKTSNGCLEIGGGKTSVVRKRKEDGSLTDDVRGQGRFQ